MRVFVSSVMRGFDKERSVAKQTIEALGMIPVMAEEFGARAQSPEQACLQGVRESDCYLGIYADRYGFIGPSGEAVTVEEFREAEKRNLPILLIVKEGADEREPKLAAFLADVGEYQKGYFHGHYATLPQLGPAITKALRQQERNGARPTTVVGPRERLEQWAKTDGRRANSPTLIVAVYQPRTATTSMYVCSRKPTSVSVLAKWADTYPAC